MARIGWNDSKIALVNGATWGTAVDATAAGGLMHGRIAVTDAFGEHTPADIGFDNFYTVMTRLERNVGVQLTCEIAYNQLWTQVLANILGASTAVPAETTVGQGDYVHDIDLTSNNDGHFQTLAWLRESNKATEISSVKWTGCTITLAANAPAIFTAQGIGDKVIDESVAGTGSIVNTQAKVSALSYPTPYQVAVLGDTNHYFRMNDQSGGALSSSDDFEVLGATITLNRQPQQSRPLRGANTPYTVEPREIGLIEGSIQFQLTQILEASQDVIADWIGETGKKIEILLDGAQIGTGTNAGYKFAFPSAKYNNKAGYSPEANNTYPEPNLTMRLLQASAAPTGMTGITNYMRCSATETRSTALV